MFMSQSISMEIPGRYVPIGIGFPHLVIILFRTAFEEGVLLSIGQYADEPIRASVTSIRGQLEFGAAPPCCSLEWRLLERIPGLLMQACGDSLTQRTSCGVFAHW